MLLRMLILLAVALSTQAQDDDAQKRRRENREKLERDADKMADLLAPAKAKLEADAVRRKNSPGSRPKRDPNRHPVVKKRPECKFEMEYKGALIESVDDQKRCIAGE